MKNYLAQKIIEWLLTNVVMFKDVDYRITEALSSEHEYIIHNLKTEIDDDILWFGNENISDIPIELIDDVLIMDDMISIMLKDNKYIKIEIIR